MTPQRDDHARDARVSQLTSRDDEDTYSNKATGGSSDSGSDAFGPRRTRSRSPERGRSITRGRLFDQHTSQPRNRTLTSSPFMGLALDPLPPAMLPNKKRPLAEVLSDETPPEKDKMSVELDQLARKAHDQTPGSSGIGSNVPDGSPRPKKSKANEELLDPQMSPTITRDPSGGGRNSPTGRSGHEPATSRGGSRANSDP
ncbi:hypothetical protein F4808DRAFT_433126 [Astrocystis sublimbata]|nr:hypothetical protein F4808DRAFT_433126 [Astrocystis sublimbata]